MGSTHTPPALSNTWAFQSLWCFEEQCCRLICNTANAKGTHYTLAVVISGLLKLDEVLQFF